MITIQISLEQDYDETTTEDKLRFPDHLGIKETVALNHPLKLSTDLQHLEFVKAHGF